MKNITGASEQPGTGKCVLNVGALDSEIGIAAVISQVRLAAPAHFVQHANRKATIQLQVGHMATDKPSPSRHDHNWTSTHSTQSFQDMWGLLSTSLFQTTKRM